MKMKSLFPLGHLLGAAMLMASAGAAVAQEELSESHIEAARAVVQEAQALDTFDNILPLMAEQTRTLFIQSDPARTQEIEMVTNEVALEMAKRRSELNRIVYEVWARRFSEEELRQLAEFYRSPLGKKLSENGPTITALSVGAARQWQDAMSTEMVALVRERLDALAQPQ
ncbi:hypothetical protein GCM10011316_13020 [Roseibium aquae]|uniref:DUF2059 domain-containing protein n=1 Tax=Roseibium aquae TaxID=1323746 RepID=A0A916THP4_9HYPH|nr:DUF2059 domain-containing protein [Roseibium aquae]GGB42516.1 hypothetical protein GCM10011316_13020 [Roseibium aquae]